MTRWTDRWSEKDARDDREIKSGIAKVRHHLYNNPHLSSTDLHVIESSRHHEDQVADAVIDGRPVDHKAIAGDVIMGELGEHHRAFQWHVETHGDPYPPSHNTWTGYDRPSQRTYYEGHDPQTWMQG